MPLNETDKSWIRETIQTAHKVRGWGAFQRFVKEWSGFGAAIAVLLFALTQYTSYIEFRTTTTNKLSEIGTHLNNIDGQITASRLRTQASLAGSDFRDDLPDLTSTLKAARQQKVSVSKAVLRDMRKNFAVTPASSPAYWPAAAQLISYSSQVSLGWEYASMPLCSKTDLRFTNFIDKPLENGTGLIEHGPIIFRHCTITLDSPEAGEILSMALALGDVVFEDCQINYAGGVIAIKPIAFSASMPPLTSGTITFNGCRFSWNLPDAPAIPGQKLTADILLAGNEAVRFSPAA